MRAEHDLLKAIVLAVAILDLGSAYILFSYQQLLSFWAMAGLLLLMLLSFIFMFLIDELSSGRIYGLAGPAILFLLSAVLLLYSISYDWSVITHGFYANLGVPILLAFISSLIILAFGVFSKRKIHDLRFYMSFIAFAALLTLIALLVTNYFGISSSYTPTDEAAFNYYSAYLAMHMQNPYTSNMSTALSTYRIIPIPLVNGSSEVYYGYPPLSFITFLPLVPFWPDAYALKLLTILFASLGALIMYYKSRSNRYMIFPVFLFLAFSFSFSPVSNTYLAISILLVLAFVAMTKKQPTLSGILLGAAFGIHQASWFAAPFFLIFTYNNFGKGALVRQLAGAAAVLLLISLPFVQTPTTYVGNLFGLFGRSNTLLGVNLAGLMIGSFAVPNTIIVFFAVSAFLLSIILYYLYEKSFASLIALAPAFIFILSWKSTISYSMPYIVLFVAMTFWEGKNTLNDRFKDKRWALGAVMSLLLAFLVLSTYYHAQYVNNPALNISEMYFELQHPPTYLNNTIIRMQLDVTNYMQSNQTVLFLIFSSNPYGYDWQPFPSYHIPPGKTGNYLINAMIPLNKDTEIGVIIINKNYIRLTALNYSYIT
jgi:uncharacterized membrane protein